MKNLEKKFLIKNGKQSKAYLYVLPDDLAKKENKEQAVELAQELGLLYAIVSGVARLVHPSMEKAFQHIATSYIREDGLRFQYGREQKIKYGGVNYKHLIEAILDGSSEAISFAKNCRNQNFQNIKTIR